MRMFFSMVHSWIGLCIYVFSWFNSCPKQLRHFEQLVNDLYDSTALSIIHGAVRRSL